MTRLGAIFWPKIWPPNICNFDHFLIEISLQKAEKNVFGLKKILKKSKKKKSGLARNGLKCSKSPKNRFSNRYGSIESNFWPKKRYPKYVVLRDKLSKFGAYICYVRFRKKKSINPWYVSDFFFFCVKSSVRTWRNFWHQQSKNQTRITKIIPFFLRFLSIFRDKCSECVVPMCTTKP